MKKKKKDPLDRWALEPGFKANLKRSDQLVSQFFTTVTSTVANLVTTIPQAVGDNSRVGQRVRFFNWHVRGSILLEPGASGSVQSDYLRVIFFYDRQTNGAAPTWATLVANISTGTSASYDPPNWYQRGRFKVIRDFKVATPPVAFTVAAGLVTTSSGIGFPSPTSQEVQIDFFKALKGKLDCEWSGTGSTVANINGGGLFVALQSANNTNAYVMNITSSVEYMDV